MACGSFVTELYCMEDAVVRSKYFTLDQKVLLASTSKLFLDYQGNMLYMVIGKLLGKPNVQCNGCNLSASV